MADYEIIKNLEACKEGNCTDCSLNCIKSEACITLLCSYAFELINCQQAEIERLEKIDNQTAADVAPVKHGHWEEIRDAYGQLEGWMCKKCGREMKAKENYCPNCGAKMDDEKRSDQK